MRIGRIRARWMRLCHRSFVIDFGLYSDYYRANSIVHVCKTDDSQLKAVLNRSRLFIDFWVGAAHKDLHAFPVTDTRVSCATNAYILHAWQRYPDCICRVSHHVCGVYILDGVNTVFNYLCLTSIHISKGISYNISGLEICGPRCSVFRHPPAKAVLSNLKTVSLAPNSNLFNFLTDIFISQLVMRHC